MRTRCKDCDVELIKLERKHGLCIECSMEREGLCAVCGEPRPCDHCTGCGEPKTKCCCYEEDGNDCN